MTRPVLTPLDGVGIIGTDELVDSAVTSAKLATDAVTAAKIAAGQVGTSEIADANVTNAKLAADAVTTSKIADGQVTSAKIANGTINEADIASNAPGWGIIPLRSGWGPPAFGEQVTYTRFGNLIIISGGVRRNGGSADFGDVPAGARPLVLTVAPGTTTGSNGAVVYISTGGVLTAGINVGDDLAFCAIYRGA